MADILTSLPIKITNAVSSLTADVTASSALKVDVSATGANATAILVTGTGGTFPVTGTVTANQGTAAAGSSAWPIAITNTSDTVVKPGDSVNSAIRVNIVAGGSGGASQVDESSFVEGTTSFTPIGGVLNDIITSDPTEDQAAAARITAKRALHVNLRDSSGVEFGTTGNPIIISGSGGSLSVTIGSEKAEDSGHVTGATGNFILAVRNDAEIAFTGTDLDYSPIAVDKAGRVKVSEQEAGIVAYYATVSSVAHTSTGTISYTVTAGKTFYLKQIISSASGGPCKITLDDSTAATYAVGFFSSANPVFNASFAQPIKFAAGVTVNVKIMNNGGAAQDVYASIFGHEV
jgi:hypothetical protein